MVKRKIEHNISAVYSHGIESFQLSFQYKYQVNIT